MKPFNLEEAIQGKPLVTRDGKKVLDFHYFKNSDVAYPVIAFIEGRASLSEYLRNGQFTPCNSNNPLDLFMYEEPKSYYSNLYKEQHNRPYVGTLYDSLEEAKKMIQHKGFIKTIEITIP